jgi:hypothetical protein
MGRQAFTCAWCDGELDRNHRRQIADPHSGLSIWRWTQSHANFSLPEFPANREKYREYCALNRNTEEISLYQRLLWHEKLRSCDESEQGSNRE